MPIGRIVKNRGEGRGIIGGGHGGARPGPSGGNEKKGWWAWWGVLSPTASTVRRYRGNWSDFSLVLLLYLECHECHCASVGTKLRWPLASIREEDDDG